MAKKVLVVDDELLARRMLKERKINRKRNPVQSGAGRYGSRLCLRRGESPGMCKE